MATAFVGTWTIETSDNFESYLKAAGVKTEMPKDNGSNKPSVDVTINGDTWSLNITAGPMKYNIDFKLGVEFDEKTPDGRTVKTTFTLDGDKLVQVQKGEVESTIIREIKGNTMIVTAKAQDVVATAELVKG